MVQVIGPDEDACHVFRPWSEADLVRSMAYLLSIAANREKFAVAVVAFCREFSPTFPVLQRLLSRKMGSVEHSMIRDRLVGDFWMLKPRWEEMENRPNVLAVKDLSDHVRAVFLRM